MKRNFLTLIGMLGLGISVTQSQTLINSWENSLEGWSVLESGTWTSVGFSTTKGATQGSYSWQLTTTGVDYNPTLRGPLSTNLTWIMANAASVNMDIVIGTNAPQFNWGIQIDLEVNQPGGVGTMSVDGYNYPGDVYGGSLTDGSTNTLTWPVLQAVRTALDAYPNLPVYLTLSVGGGGGGAIFIDNLRVNLIPQTQANLWVRELWDDLPPGDQLPSLTSVTDDSSSVGFAADPWGVNPAETNNCQIMAVRQGFGPGDTAINMGLPGTLDGSYGVVVQQNNGFSFFPTNQGTFWTAGDFMTRALTPDNYINFQAAGEYWFSMTIANKPYDWNSLSGSLYSQYVTFPSSGWGGLGFADGSTTNSDFVAVGVTGLNVWLGPTNVSAFHGDTNVSKALYISQGTLGQPGDPTTQIYNPLNDPNSNPLDQPPYGQPYNQQYSQTNFSGGPYHINAYGAQTVGILSGDYIVVLGHLKTFGNGTATLDAKYYFYNGLNPWNYNLDINPNTITWDCSYAFNFSGTMTRLLLFQNGQFPFYIYGFRASKSFNEVVGLDPGRITVSPTAHTFVGYAINMTNLTVEASPVSFVSPPGGYGTLNYQWYTNGVAIGGATAQNYNIASATLADAGTYTCVATDPSGTWGSVTNSVDVTVTVLNPPRLTGVQMVHDGTTFTFTFDEPNLTGVADLTHYAFTGGIVGTNVVVINGTTSTKVQIRTTALPLGTKTTLTVSGVTNVVGGTLTPTNLTFWTDLIRPGAANFDTWLDGVESDSDYFNTYFPAHPTPTIAQSFALTSWEGPTAGITNVGTDGYVGDGFGGKLYGWFIPPVTADYVFLISCDDGARLSLSTNSSATNLFVIACESLWSGPDQWTNISDSYPGPGQPHRGDGTATGVGPTGYVWDNSIAGQSPATASLQNRSDQFIVAYYDSTGITNGAPPGATNYWVNNTWSKVEYCVLPGMTNDFWPNVDANGQALIHLQAGQMYYLQLDSVQQGGGFDESVTYKLASDPDPHSPSATALTGAVIAGTVPFTPTISIAHGSGPVITYTGVLLAGTSVSGITNVVAQSSAATAISLGGPSQYIPPNTTTNMFYRTSE